MNFYYPRVVVGVVLCVGTSLVVNAQNPLLPFTFKKTPSSLEIFGLEFDKTNPKPPQKNYEGRIVFFY